MGVRLSAAHALEYGVGSAFRQAGDLGTVAEVLCGKGWVHLERGDYAAARRLGEESLDLAMTIASPRLISQDLGLLGEMYWQDQDYVNAEAAYRHMLDVSRPSDDHRGQVQALHGLSRVHAQLARHELADSCLRPS